MAVCRYSAPGQDHHAKVVIDLEDTYRGAQRTISLETPVLDASGRAVLKSRTLDVSIPKGVYGGQHLRLAGQGGAGFGEGRAGDLYLEIALRQHGLFRVDGRDVTIDRAGRPLGSGTWRAHYRADARRRRRNSHTQRFQRRPTLALERQGNPSERSGRYIGRSLCAIEHRSAAG